MHRLDIRVGVASSMSLKQFVPDRAGRIGMLAMMYPAYSRLPTRAIALSTQERKKEFAFRGADASRRADIYAAAWASVEAMAVNTQVVCYRDEWGVGLLQRCERQSP